MSTTPEVPNPSVTAKLLLLGAMTAAAWVLGVVLETLAKGTVRRLLAILKMVDKLF